MPTSPSPSITAIVAATVSNGIGLNGGLPWRLPGEMKYFARVTTGEHSGDTLNTVIMGRKTWESIPAKFRPLKDRRNIVISRRGVQLSLTDEVSTTTHDSLQSAISSLSSHIPTTTHSQAHTHSHRAFLIGGSQLYTQALTTSPTLVDRVLLTRIVQPDFDCDTHLTDFASQSDQQGKIWRPSSHAELCDWVGWQVPSGEIEEKGVRYKYEMWTRRNDPQSPISSQNQPNE